MTSSSPADVWLGAALARVSEINALAAKATPGRLYHYDQVFRSQFSRRRVTEIQMEKDGTAVVAWGGFDALRPKTRKKRNQNARFLVALANFYRDGLLNTLLTCLATERRARAEAERKLEEARAALDRIIEGAPTEEPEPHSDSLGYVSQDPDDNYEAGKLAQHWDLAEIARAARAGASGPSLTARLTTTEVENARLRAALEPFVFGDPTLERILYDGMPDDAPCTFTIKLGDVRRARAALAASSKEATDEQA